jgi:DNA-binding FadR family transcriptional regulator
VTDSDVRASTLASAGAALFRPVRTGNAFEETVERLLQAIRLGVAAPGERLPAERVLATRLNISRVTLREAIRALQEAGYVESRRGRYGGTFVNETLPMNRPVGHASPEELDDVLTMRRVLEVGAAEAAAARTLTPTDREYLKAQLRDAAIDDLKEYRRRDSRLHLAIAEVAASPTLTSAVADVRVRINEFLDEIPLLDTNIDHSNVQHEEIVQRILDGNPCGARDAMAEHLAGTASLLRGFLS